MSYRARCRPIAHMNRDVCNWTGRFSSCTSFGITLCNCFEVPVRAFPSRVMCSVMMTMLRQWTMTKMTIRDAMRWSVRYEVECTIRHRSWHRGALLCACSATVVSPLSLLLLLLLLRLCVCVCVCMYMCAPRGARLARVYT